MNDTIMKLENLVDRHEKYVANAEKILAEERAVLEAFEDKLEAAREAEEEAQSGPWDWSCTQCIHDIDRHYDRKPVCYNCGWHHGGKIDYSTPPDKYVNWLTEAPLP